MFFFHTMCQYSMLICIIKSKTMTLLYAESYKCIYRLNGQIFFWGLKTISYSVSLNKLI